MRAKLFLAFFVGLPLLISTVYARVWTDKTGTHKIEAELVTVENDVVQLKKPDGTVIKVPINKLCEDDGNYAQRNGEQGFCRAKGRVCERRRNAGL